MAEAKPLDMGELLGGSSLAESVEFVRACLYGHPGHGKTTAAAYLAHLGPVAFFPIEPGLKRTALERLKVPVKNIITSDAQDYEEFMETWDRLRAALRKKPGSVAGVVFDSATEQVARSVNRVRRETFNRIAERAERRGEDLPTDKNGKPLSRFGVDRSYYGEMTSEVRDIMEHYLDLPCHLVYTAHVRRDEDQDGEVTYGPAVTPAVQNDLIGYMDVLMWVRKLGVYDDGSPVIIGTTAHHPKYQTKDRFGVLPPHMAMPTMDRIVAYVNGQLTSDKDPVQKRYVEWVANARRRETEEEED